MTPNETETEKLTGIYPIDIKAACLAVKVLLKRGLEIAVIKIGNKGVCFLQRMKGFIFPFRWKQLLLL
ncbi:ribokinase [Bartonella sp. JB63]|nr:ribokinase [Bartonella sp. JB15]AQX29540.1 ribokinase [Bartonella sp. JB63]